MVFVGSQEPGAEVLDYYFSLLPRRGARAPAAASTWSRCRTTSPRSVAEKLLDQPDAARRGAAGDRRPARATSSRGTSPTTRSPSRSPCRHRSTAPIPTSCRVAHKSSGRRVFREAGVPLPYGHEDVRTVDDVVRAAHDIHRRRPSATAVVVKHDDSGAGDGNAVVDLRGDVRGDVESLPAWYLRDLRNGGVVEERVEGVAFTSPSAQVDVSRTAGSWCWPTHEQELGGAGDQVYMGCRFPAEPAYAAELGRHAAAVGAALAGRGAVGRLGVDFAVARDADGGHAVHALEVNLRKGGTTHPFTVLRSHVPGRYDVEAGRWVAAADGSARAYRATDNLLDPGWVGPATRDRPAGGRRPWPAPRPRDAAPAWCCTCCPAWPWTAASASPRSAGTPTTPPSCSTAPGRRSRRSSGQRRLAGRLGPAPDRAQHAGGRDDVGARADDEQPVGAAVRAGEGCERGRPQGRRARAASPRRRRTPAGRPRTGAGPPTRPARPARSPPRRTPTGAGCRAPGPGDGGRTGRRTCARSRRARATPGRAAR